MRRPAICPGSMCQAGAAPIRFSLPGALVCAWLEDDAPDLLALDSKAASGGGHLAALRLEDQPCSRSIAVTDMVPRSGNEHASAFL